MNHSTATTYSFTRRKRTKDSLFSEHYYRDSFNFYEVSYREFVYQFFADAGIRHPDSRVVVCEMTVSENDKSHIYPKRQETHIVLNKQDSTRIKHSDTHISPYLYRDTGNHRGKGIRLKELSTCAVGIGLDFDSMESFGQADKKKDDLGLPEWDFVCYTGGRGAQAWYYIDAFPLLTQKQKSFFNNVKDSLILLLNADRQGGKSTQLLRLPDTRHPRTGNKSKGYIRKDFKKDSRGKLLRLANRLRELKVLKHTPRPKREKPIKETKEMLYKKLIDERLSRGPMTGKLPDLAGELGIPFSSFRKYVHKYAVLGEYTVSHIRNKNRNGGVVIEKSQYIQEHSEKTRSYSTLYSDGTGHRQKLSVLYKGYLDSGSNVDYRNTVLFSLAVWLCVLRVNAGIARKKLWQGNLKSPVPLSESEFKRTFDSAYSGKYGGVASQWLSECLKGVGTVDNVNSSESEYADFDPQMDSSHSDDCDCSDCCPEMDFKSDNVNLDFQVNQITLNFADIQNVFGNVTVIETGKNYSNNNIIKVTQENVGTLKRCQECGKVKQRYEYFVGTGFSDGLFPVCKLCCKRIRV